jgi:hypothetical protein
MKSSQIKTKLPDLENKDRIYRLKRASPPYYALRSKGGKTKALLYFDEENKVNRPLRYSSNQLTPFEDEQDDNPVMEPVVFENGLLSVPRTNPLLQIFLAIHPAKGSTFEEIDKGAQADEELVLMKLEDDASDLAKAIVNDIDMAEAMYPKYFGKHTRNLTSSEIKADIRRLAKRDPKRFIRITEESDAGIEHKVSSFLNKGLVQWRKNKTQLFFNLPSNKKKMLDVIEGEDPMESVELYFDSEEGVEAIREIERVAATK